MNLKIKRNSAVLGMKQVVFLCVILAMSHVNFDVCAMRFRNVPFKWCSLFNFCFKSKKVVSKNNEYHFEVLHVSSNVDYVPERYRGNETIN